MGTSIDLTISIASYNTRELLKNCLKSIYSSEQDLKIEIYVIDNDSKDGSTQMVTENFPEVNLICNHTNFFFAKAHNKALKKARGKYILILNSDTLIPKNTFKNMMDFMEKYPNAAAASCREVDGKVVDLTCSHFSTPTIEFFESNILSKFLKNEQILYWYRYQNWQRDTIKKVDVIPGSFIFAKTNVIKNLGLFDENFFLFYAENDLCLKIKKAGFDIYHNGAVTITHLKSQSINKLNSWLLLKLSLHDMLYYYKKHFGFFSWQILWVLYRPNWLYWRLKTVFTAPANL